MVKVNALPGIKEKKKNYLQGKKRKKRGVILS
jgi:hypothetical protein